MAEAALPLRFAHRTRALAAVQKQWRARGNKATWTQSEWRAAFESLHLGPENAPKREGGGRDDMLYFVPMASAQTAAEGVPLEVRRWTATMPESIKAKAEDIDWMRSVFVNLAACARYRLSVVVAEHSALSNLAAPAEPGQAEKRMKQSVGMTCYASPYARTALGDASFLAGGRENDASLSSNGGGGSGGNWLSRGWGALTKKGGSGDEGSGGDTAFASCFPNLAFAVEVTDSSDADAGVMALDEASDCFCVVLRCTVPLAPDSAPDERPPPAAVLFSGFVRHKQLVDALLLKRKLERSGAEAAVADGIGMLVKPAAALARGIAGAFRRGPAPLDTPAPPPPADLPPPTATHVRMKGPGGRGGADVSVEARGVELDASAAADAPTPKLRCALIHVRLPWDALMDTLLSAADADALARVFF